MAREAFPAEWFKGEPESPSFFTRRGREIEKRPANTPVQKGKTPDVYESVARTLSKPVPPETGNARVREPRSTGGGWRPSANDFNQTVDTSTLTAGPAPRSSNRTMRAPSFGAGGAGGGGGAGPRFNKTATSRIIILSIGIAGVAIIAEGANTPPGSAQVGGHNVTIPGNMRAFAGLITAGTIALIVNEVSAELGAVMALGMVFIAFADTGLYKVIGGIFGNAPQVNGKGIYTGAVPKLKPGQRWVAPDGNTYVGGSLKRSTP